MRFGNLTGVATSILSDTRPVANPWGILDSAGRPFTAIVLRDNHDDWTSFVAANNLNDPQIKKRQKAHIKAALSTTQRAGFRNRGANSPEKLIDKLADDLVNTGLDPDAASAKLARKKEGAARVLFQGGLGIDDENDKPIDLGVEENRLALLNLVEIDGEPFALTAEYLFEWVGEWDERTGAWKQGGHYEPMTDPDDAGLPAAERTRIQNPYRDMLFGDAVLQWLEDEGAQTEVYYKTRENDVLGNSAGSPVGSMTTGAVVTPASDEPSSEV